MDIKKVGVIGAGTMGAGIAQVCVEAGLSVILIDIEKEFINRGLNTIFRNWEKAIAREKVSEGQVAEFKESLVGSTDKKILAECDLIIEAVVEKIEIKQELFQELDKICPANTIFSSNTSALSITEIGAVTSRSDKVIGVHFFNPVPAMKLIEIIPATETSKETVQKLTDFSNAIGKEPVVVKESPGFIVNRILIPYINEAATIYYENVATAEQIDKAMKLGANMPMGPLALADLIGIDVCLMIMDYFWNEMGDSKYRPSLALKQKVRAGHLGRKTRKGFFDYE